MSVLSLDASQSVKLTLMKDISYCLVRSDKLGRRRDVLVVFNDQPEGYVLSYGDWLHFINQVSGRRILFGFYRRMRKYFPDAPGRNFSRSCPAGALPSAGNVRRRPIESQTAGAPPDEEAPAVCVLYVP